MGTESNLAPEDIMGRVDHNSEHTSSEQRFPLGNAFSLRTHTLTDARGPDQFQPENQSRAVCSMSTRISSRCGVD